MALPRGRDGDLARRGAQMGGDSVAIILFFVFLLFLLTFYKKSDIINMDQVMLCVGSNQSVAARIKMAQIEGIDKAGKREYKLYSLAFYFLILKCFCSLPFNTLICKSLVSSYPLQTPKPYVCFLYWLRKNAGMHVGRMHTAKKNKSHQKIPQACRLEGMDDVFRK